ncbi:hypothetical protein PR048_017690 [Dryococelus australis]|uniref:Uncharacterized protein n=1 Tax=Dryococelus australis TaxID=614101 RepID=A0ABQ9HAE4_9NEOP|nr:hypothetical protein PR048_017690 [Dryococelus australis]
MEKQYSHFLYHDRPRGLRSFNWLFLSLGGATVQAICLPPSQPGVLLTFSSLVPIATHKTNFKLDASLGNLRVDKPGATVADRLACSPSAKANRIQSPAGSTDFNMWESCRTMPLVGGFSQVSPVSPAPSFRYCSILTLIGSQYLTVKSPPKYLHSLNAAALRRTEGKVKKSPMKHVRVADISPFIANYFLYSYATPLPDGSCINTGNCPVKGRVNAATQRACRVSCQVNAVFTLLSCHDINVKAECCSSKIRRKVRIGWAARRQTPSAGGEDAGFLRVLRPTAVPLVVALSKLPPKALMKVDLLVPYTYVWMKLHTRASAVCSLDVAPESSQCFTTLGSYGIRHVFPCESVVGPGTSRACLENCDPIATGGRVVCCCVELPYTFLHSHYTARGTRYALVPVDVWKRGVAYDLRAPESKGGGNVRSRENPPTSGIVQPRLPHAKIRGDPAGNRTRFATVGGEWSNHYTTAAPPLVVIQGILTAQWHSGSS